MRLLTLFIFGFWCFSAFGQDSVLVTKNFYFENGIYESFNALKNNKPTYSWDDVTSTYFTNPKTLLAEVQSLVLKESDSDLSFEKVYAVCIKGIPYLKLDRLEDDEMAKFAGLKVRGTLGYHSYTISKVEKVKIQAYNPLNGQPFRTGYFNKEKTEKIEKVLNWADGKIYDFNQSNLINLIKNDVPLLNSIEDLEEWEVEEKLFKCLLIYNDRHSIYVPKRSL